MASRQYVQKEWRLLSWWLATYHPNADISMNVRLGPMEPRLPLGPGGVQPVTASRVFQRYADTVFVENGDPWLVEAKLEPDPGIFSQLIHYARFFRADPAWKQFANRTLHLVAVVYSNDPSVADEAPWYGVQWEVFQPNLEMLAPPRVRLPIAGISAESPMLPDNWAARLNSWGIKAFGAAG
ncbi:MAG TPA: hypothetical protein VKH81_03890 [Candidatus Angelobacter sp.]|nr:hypothetical protein [Candidatus Angelobacter sp.]